MNRRQMLVGALAGFAAAVLNFFVPATLKPAAPKSALRDLYRFSRDRTVLKKVRMAQLKIGDVFQCYEDKRLLGTFTCLTVPRQIVAEGIPTVVVQIQPA